MKTSGNVALQFISRQYVGTGQCNITQVHTEILSRYPGLVSQVVPLMKIIETSICNGLAQELIILLDKFYGQLQQTSGGALIRQLAIVFNKEGGVDLLVTLILSFFQYDSPLNNAKFGSNHKKVDAMQIQKLCLGILRKLSILDPDCRVALATCDILLAHCFCLLKSTTLAETACNFIEHLLLSRKKLGNDLVQLDGIKRLHDVLQQLDDETLSRTYRILSLSVSESDVEKCENIVAQHRQQLNTRINGMTVSSLNRDFDVAVPGLLGKVLNYACSLPLGGFTDSHLAVLEDAFLNGLETRSQDSEQLRRRNSALHLLSLMLKGSQRGRVQEMLAKLSFGPLLSALFEQFLWNYEASTTRPIANQRNRSSDIFKIKLLALVDDFCFHNTFKHVLLSYDEMDELKQLHMAFENPALSSNTNTIQPSYHPSSSFSASTSSSDNLPYCTSGVGLISKIIRVLKTVPISTTFRYWMSQAVESWLRSDSQYGVADYLFVISRGLLHHIVNDLLESGSAAEPAMVVAELGQMHQNNNRAISSGPEISFDLLGGMMRLNMEACRQLDICLSTEVKISKYLEVVHNNLIDSNKFIRSVFLTMDHFMEGGRVGRFQQAATFFSTSKFFSLFLELNKRVCYLALLVSTISIDTLTMENVSCLNTVLIILILSTRQGTLTNYLKMLATRTVDQLDLEPTESKNKERI